MKLTQRTLFLILEALLFVICSAVFFTFISSVGNLIGASDSPLKRMLPYYLSVVGAIYLLFVSHIALFPTNEKKLQKTLKINGIILAAWGLLSAVLIVIYVVNHTYSSFIMGMVSSLFPLDYFLLDLLVMAVGAFFAYQGFRFPKGAERTYFPYEHSLTRKIFASIFRPLYVLVALYFTGAFFFCVGIANYGSSTWWCMLSLWLLMGVPGATLFYHEFFYKNGKDHPREQSLKIALCALLGSAFFVFYFLIAILVKRNFIVEDATALFTIDFMKSWNLVPFAATFEAILPPAIAYLSLFISIRKGKKPTNVAAEKPTEETAVK